MPIRAAKRHRHVQSQDDEKFMRRCFALALRGKGKTSPNPLVGAVIVHRGKIIGQGYHKKYGSAHAEVNAIASVRDESLLKHSTLYVNLEPCSHFGKTPPCADLIIEKKIPRVVVGCKDPFAKVSGRGIKKLRDAGVLVRVGVLEAEAERLNEAFMKSHRTDVPFVGLKLAQSLDGKIAAKTKDSKWITSEAARAYAHELRAGYDAIMVSTNTALADNPTLTVRLVAGRNPIRVLLDRQLRLPLNANLYNSDAPTIVFTSRFNKKHPKAKMLLKKGFKVFFVSEKNEYLNLREVMETLHDEKILSVMVEGGARLFASLLEAGFCDKVHAFIAPKLVGGDGISSIGDLGLKKIADSISLTDVSVKIFSDGLLVEGYTR
jgi:diaminohydroxyphosphoribosylaminopyrimidine deaminase / 5-amino-6-(5-phosphoribosylamino)uracil reductase